MTKNAKRTMTSTSVTEPAGALRTENGRVMEINIQAPGPTSRPGRPLIDPFEPSGNDGFDNKDGELIVRYNDQIEDPETGKVFVTKLHYGEGEFGHVYKVALLGKTPSSYFAMKISKNEDDAIEQFNCEAQILNYIHSSLPPECVDRICKIEAFFIHKRHACLVIEALGPSLLKVLKERKFSGMGLDLIQSVLKDILSALVALASLELIHCDVKPENILLQNMVSEQVKLIDFGQVCSCDDAYTSYVQSRFYRSPEVILQIPYDSKIDVWSLGCVAAELMLGLPIFPAQSQAHLIYLINKMLGPFQKEYIELSPVKELYFLPDGTIKSGDQLGKENNEDFESYVQYFRHKQLDEIIMSYPMRPDASENYVMKETHYRSLFVDLLNKMLKLNPKERISAADALKEPFMQMDFKNDGY